MSRFKTELCNNLIELGSCKYGDRCHYAHGAHELRQVSRRHPKYRTERCKNFELTGKCPFGPRCSYVHPKPDLDSMIEQLTKYMKHTEAPKPDFEDDDDICSLPFTRTNTSSSALDSMATSSNPTTDDENKENQQERVYKPFNPVISRRNISSPLKTLDFSTNFSLSSSTTLLASQNQSTISKRNPSNTHHHHHYHPLKTIDLSSTLTNETLNHNDADVDGDDDTTDGENNENNHYHTLKQLNQKRSPLSLMSNKQFYTRF